VNLEDFVSNFQEVESFDYQLKNNLLYQFLISHFILHFVRTTSNSGMSAPLGKPDTKQKGVKMGGLLPYWQNYKL